MRNILYLLFFAVLARVGHKVYYNGLMEVVPPLLGFVTLTLAYFIVKSLQAVNE